MPRELDQFDLKILDAMQADSTKSAQQLGEDVGLSQPACWKRINRLAREGYIRKQVALLDGEKIGAGTTVFATVKLASQDSTSLNAFAQAVQRIPNIMACYVLMGDMDFMLQIVVDQIQDYEKLYINVLSKIEGVAEFKSTMALSTIKQTTAFPISVKSGGDGSE
ncbi:MAG: Lrp/AsnC family transcriptional regulator [Pseudomonadota bacterium]